MIVGRIIGWIFLIAAAAVFVYDAVTWIDTGMLTLITVGELWFTIDTDSLNLVQAIIQRYLLPGLWDPVIVTVLLWPALFALAVPGVALRWLFRPRRRKTGMFAR